MPKHTPGPWRYDESRCAIVADHPPAWWTADADEEPTVQIVYLRSAMGGWNTAADRALMCAGPDMLAAIKRAVEHYGMTPGNDVFGLVAALSKAEDVDND